jgi:hypothetical protein
MAQIMTNFGNRDKANDKIFSQKQRKRERKGSYPKITIHSHIDYMLI